MRWVKLWCGMRGRLLCGGDVVQMRGEARPWKAGVWMAMFWLGEARRALMKLS